MARESQRRGSQQEAHTLMKTVGNDKKRARRQRIRSTRDGYKSKHAEKVHLASVKTVETHGYDSEKLRQDAVAAGLMRPASPLSLQRCKQPVTMYYIVR